MTWDEEMRKEAEELQKEIDIAAEFANRICAMIAKEGQLKRGIVIITVAYAFMEMNLENNGYDVEKSRETRTHFDNVIHAIRTFSKDIAIVTNFHKKPQ